MTRLDWTIVRTAATGGLIIIVPGAFLAAQLFDGGATTAWAWLFLAVVLLGFAVAGYIAGRLRSDTPMLHGAVGSLLAFVVAQGFGIALTLSRSGSINWAAIPLTALFAVVLGVAGALLSDRVHRRQARLARSRA